MMNNRFLLALLAALAASFPAWSSDIGKPATWQSSRSAELNRTRDLPKLTEALIANFDPDGNIVPTTVSEAQFIDLDNDGTLELVALVDYSGRQFFSTMIVITTVNAKPVVVTYRSNGANMDRLGERIITEPENPKKLIVADRFIGDTKGRRQAPKNSNFWNSDRPHWRMSARTIPVTTSPSVYPHWKNRPACLLQSIMQTTSGLAR